MSSAALLAALTRDIDDRVPASTYDYIGAPAGGLPAEDAEIKQETFKLIGELVRSHEALA